MKRMILVAVILLMALQVWALDLLPPMDEYWISSGSGYRDDPMGGKEGS